MSWPVPGPRGEMTLTLASVCVQVEVPVNVQVVVDPGSQCDVDIATVNAPVTVIVSLQLLVNGKVLGSGESDLDYATCKGTPQKKWKRCAGQHIKKDGTATSFRKGCQEGLQCVKRDDTHATCMPPLSRNLYIKSQGWNGSILKCR
jgi:hypothetical protein